MIKKMMLAPDNGAGTGGDFISGLAQQPPATEAPAQQQPPAKADTGATATAELPGWGSAVTKELRADPQFTEFAKQYPKLDDAVKSAMAYASKAKETPAKPDEYELDLDKEIQYNDQELAAFKDLAHKLGLTKAQAKELHKLASAQAKAAMQSYTEKQATADRERQEKVKADYNSLDATLKKEWGPSFTENYELARRGMTAYATPELMKALSDAGLGNRIEIVKHFHALGQLTREDSALYKSGKSAKILPTEDVFYGKGKD
jgi:hypothetical protein